MPNPLFRPPRHLVKEWPEVFEDLYMNTMPVAYLEFVVIEFDDGKIWQIDVKDQLKDEDADSVCSKILEILQEYKDSIKKLDFTIDIEKLKKDILSSTQKLF